MLRGHGGNLAEVASRLKVSIDSIIDFSASIHYPISPKRLHQWAQSAMDDVGSYTDPESHQLRELLAKKYSLRKGNILPGNGSSELLYLIPRALKCEKALLVAPSYADYADACRSAGLQIKMSHLDESDGFDLNPEKLDRMAGKYDLVVIGNPNNPTGNVLTRRTLLKVIDKNPKSMFLIDEAFMDFLPGESVINSLRPNLIVVRSLTKFYGIPGARMGFAAANAGIIKELRRFKEPWTINFIAEFFASEICKSPLNEAQEVRRVGREREILFEGLSAIPHLKVYPSVANFFLVRSLESRLISSRLQALLLGKGILIRDCANFEGLDPHYFRVAVKSRKENRILIDALKECMGAK